MTWISKTSFLKELGVCSICPMEILQLLPACFLLLLTCLGDLQTEFQDFKCDENITAEIGGNVSITCIINGNITHMTVTFCTNKTLCRNESDISTFKKISTADNGRIALEININSAILHISSVQISDQRIYWFFIHSPNGHSEKNVSIQVVGPVPSTSERAVTKTVIFEKFRSEDAISKEINYSTIILVPIFVLAFVAVVLYCRKKKGAIKLPWRNPPDVYHQPRFPNDSL